MITIEDDDGKTINGAWLKYNNIILIITESTVEFFNAPYTVVEYSGMSYNVCLHIFPACDLAAEVEVVTEPKDALRKFNTI